MPWLVSEPGWVQACPGLACPHIPSVPGFCGHDMLEEPGMNNDEQL